MRYFSNPLILATALLSALAASSAPNAWAIGYATEAPAVTVYLDLTSSATPTGENTILATGAAASLSLLITESDPIQVIQALGQALDRGSPTRDLKVNDLIVRGTAQQLMEFPFASLKEMMATRAKISLNLTKDLSNPSQVGMTLANQASRALVSLDNDILVTHANPEEPGSLGIATEEVRFKFTDGAIRTVRDVFARISSHLRRSRPALRGWRLPKALGRR